jgi:hypothetical protein
VRGLRTHHELLRRPSCHINFSVAGTISYIPVQPNTAIRVIAHGLVLIGCAADILVTIMKTSRCEIGWNCCLLGRQEGRLPNSSPVESLILSVEPKLSARAKGPVPPRAEASSPDARIEFQFVPPEASLTLLKDVNEA